MSHGRSLHGIAHQRLRSAAHPASPTTAPLRAQHRGADPPVTHSPASAESAPHAVAADKMIPQTAMDLEGAAGFRRTKDEHSKEPALVVQRNTCCKYVTCIFLVLLAAGLFVWQSDAALRRIAPMLAAKRARARGQLIVEHVQWRSVTLSGFRAFRVQHSAACPLALPFSPSATLPPAALRQCAPWPGALPTCHHPAGSQTQGVPS